MIILSRTETLKLLSQERIGKEREMGKITTTKNTEIPIQADKSMIILSRENEKRTGCLKEKIAKEREMGKITTTKNTEIPIQADKSIIILSRENEKRTETLKERIGKEIEMANAD